VLKDYAADTKTIAKASVCNSKMHRCLFSSSFRDHEQLTSNAAGL
jgi:hypothetical protein